LASQASSLAAVGPPSTTSLKRASTWRAWQRATDETSLPSALAARFEQSSRACDAGTQRSRRRRTARRDRGRDRLRPNPRRESPRRSRWRARVTREEDAGPAGRFQVRELTSEDVQGRVLGSTRKAGTASLSPARAGGRVLSKAVRCAQSRAWCRRSPLEGTPMKRSRVSLRSLVTTAL
jgi:hypothetical protein